jgi:hypothetical protein
MIHCHNLPHEDHDMMTQFRVGADTPDNDPMTSAPAGPIGAHRHSHRKHNHDYTCDAHHRAAGDGHTTTTRPATTTDDPAQALTRPGDRFR